jgi:hypothetical protein
MAAGSRTLTIKFVGDSKNMTRSVKDIVSSLDDTESAGKRVATAMKQLSGDAEASFADAKDAADKLSRALGDDMVAQIQAGGRSVDGYITDLQRFGLTFDDVRTDVDELADAIRKIEATKVNIDTLKAPLKDVDDGLLRVKDSGDQSRSVLANMVGNSAEDLGALGGVAGTAGMAIGQIAEYATEGNINLSSLAKIAGPMVGVAVAGLAISKAVEAIKNKSKEAERETAALLKAQEQLRDGNFAGAAADLATEYEGTIRVAKEFGLTTDEVVGHLSGQTSATGGLNEKLKELQAASADAALAGKTELAESLGAQAFELENLIRNLEEGTVNFKAAGTEMSTTATNSAELEGALRVLYGTSGDAAEGLDGVDRSAQDYREEAQRAEQATRDLDEAYSQLTGKLDSKQAWLGLEESMRQYQWDMASGKLSTDEKRSALIDLQGEMVTYLGQLEGVPAEKQTEILAMIERGDLEAAERELTHLSRARTVNVNVIAPGGRYIPGGSNIQGATGGIVTRPTNALIGEAGPEAVIPLDSTPGSFPLSSVAGALGGTTNVYVTVQASPGTDRAALGRELQQMLLAADRTYGPVYASTRG